MPQNHIISVLVDNEFGALARIVELFSGRGYNIESLTVSEIDTANKLSRVTITTLATAHALEQIKAHLSKLIPVHSVVDLTCQNKCIEREVALVKVIYNNADKNKALEIAKKFNAKIVDEITGETENSFIFEITCDTRTVDEFIELLKPLGLAEIARTGATAIARGNKTSF